MPTACRTPLTPEQQELVAQWRYVPRWVYKRLAEVPAVRRLGADDAEAAGMLALIRAARTYKPGGASFASYARRPVACAILRAAQRWAARCAQLSLDHVGPDGEQLQALAPEVEQADVFQRERLAEALAALPPRWQHILHRLYHGHATGEEVAAGLGVSQQRVAQIHRNALLRLRARLAS